MKKKRYAIVGLSGRSRMYYSALSKEFKDTCEMVGFCDVNQTRMDYANKVIQDEFKIAPIKTYKSEQFDEMIKKEKPDTVIVTSIDRTHHKYIIRAMELGCDAITEKPMTIDAEKCQQILDTIKKTKKSLRVTFNYRYAPHSTKVRELIMNGTIGNVHSVHFEWLLNTQHGADYFRRWHRDMKNSGGLLVHKSTHHFDLVNFWLGTNPKTVFAFGDLRFYGRENAENRGVTKFYSRAHDSETSKGDPFAIQLAENEQLKAMYLDAEKEDGYYRDQSVFGDGISIYDTMAVVVRYQTGSVLTYSLNAYMPWEGFRVGINGDKGRLELDVLEKSYVNAGGDKADEGATKHKSIKIFPMFDKPYDVEIVEAKGGHGGGDPILLNDLFGIPADDPFKRAASHVDGTMSILTGICANKSIATGQVVQVGDMVKF